MKYLSLIWMLFILGCGQQSDKKQESESASKNSVTVTVNQAQDIFKSIDSTLTFALQSIEYMGATDKLYYSDRMSPTSQVTINIGTKGDEDLSITTLYVSVSAHAPLDPEIETELLALFNKYLKGFLEKTSLSSDPTFSEQLSRVAENVSPVDIQADLGRYFLSLSGEEDDGNPEHFSYLLKVIEESFQEELNDRFLKKQNS